MKKVLQTTNKFTNNIMQSVYLPRAVFNFLNCIMFGNVITMHRNVKVNKLKKFYKQHINLQIIICNVFNHQWQFFFNF